MLMGKGYRPPRLLLDSDALALSPTYGNRSNTHDGDANFDSNMVIILAALLCALVCALGLNSIVRCALRCTRSFSYEANGGVAPHVCTSSVKKEVLSRIPVSVYKSGLDIAATECPICLGEFVEGEDVRILPGCNHGFHVKCIDRWLVLHSSCPNCRQQLDEHSAITATAATTEDVRVQID